MAEHLQVTPAGIAVLFEDGEKDPVTDKGKKRRYLIADLSTLPVPVVESAEEEDAAVRGLVRAHGRELPSVTTILRMLDKPGLPWAAEKLTVAGCVELAREGALPPNALAALSRLYARELRFRQVWDRKTDRGKLSHEDLVALAAGRALPDLSTLAPDQRMFAQGLASLIADLRPTIHESEQMVASVKHGYAGRPDLVVTLGAKTLPDGSPAPEGRGLLDLKTHEELPRTKTGTLRTPYPENLLQLGLYEVARRESGYEPTDWQAVITVDASGASDFTCSWLEPERALDLLPGFRVFKDAAQRVKRPADQRPVGLGEIAA